MSEREAEYELISGGQVHTPFVIPRRLFCVVNTQGPHEVIDGRAGLTEEEVRRLSHNNIERALQIVENSNNKL